MAELKKIGITIGDVNGIGLEVILKALSNPNVYAQSTPVIYGSAKVISFYKKAMRLSELNFTVVSSADEAKPKKVNVINCWNEEVTIKAGEKTANSGKYALMSLEAAMKDVKAEKIAALTTAPFNKHAVKEAGFPFAGHTEYLAHESGEKEALMLMVAEKLRVGVVTGHLPLKEVPALITPERVAQKLNVMMRSLREDFLIVKPRVAVLGLNPHAGDEGAMGTEEATILKPVIAEMRESGHLVYGPYSADGFFGSSNALIFDGVLGMYHDQALTGFKAISFDEGVNYTAGLPIVRTSPDHGTAYDIAGKNRASEKSFRNAYLLACDSVKNRAHYHEMHRNPLQKQTDKE